MGLTSVKINNSDNNLRPTTGATDQAQTISTTALDMLQTALDEDTTHVMFTVDGADVRVTLDGSDPTANNGLFLANGTRDTWHRDVAIAAKFIRAAAADAYLHIQEMTF